MFLIFVGFTITAHECRFLTLTEEVLKHSCLIRKENIPEFSGRLVVVLFSPIFRY